MIASGYHKSFKGITEKIFELLGKLNCKFVPVIYTNIPVCIKLVLSSAKKSVRLTKKI